ncbi:unnamed protein product [Linum tenue]|uniref:Uncharacterized protein n=1 Tax=Linum tenue TaxID=586396 RepID=A0AAV0MJ69_9ROSI|nr:unnamed protein product [Linum tenue]
MEFFDRGLPKCHGLIRTDPFFSFYFIRPMFSFLLREWKFVLLTGKSPQVIESFYYVFQLASKSITQ